MRPQQARIYSYMWPEVWASAQKSADQDRLVGNDIRAVGRLEMQLSRTFGTLDRLCRHSRVLFRA